MKNYSIGQIANLVGLPTKTIRFYEQIKIIAAVPRAENGYRRYPENIIEELHLIKHSRELGLPLAEIKRLMAGCAEGRCTHTKQHIVSSLDAYLELLTHKIRQQQYLKSRLQLLKRNLGEQNCDQSTYCCDLLHQLINMSPKKGGETYAQTQ